MLPPMEPTPLDTVLLLGAIARITRLVVLDDILRPARTTFVRVAGDVNLRLGAWAAGLVGCYFCAGFWVTLPVLASWQAWGTTLPWQLAATALTLNYAAAHLNRVLDGTDDEDE